MPCIAPSGVVQHHFAARDIGTASDIQTDALAKFNAGTFAVSAEAIQRSAAVFQLLGQASAGQRGQYENCQSHTPQYHIFCPKSS